MEGTFGICVPPETSFKIPRRSRRKTPRSILTNGFPGHRLRRAPASLGPYRSFFESFGGRRHLQSSGRPTSTRVCQARPPAANDPLPVHLSPVDRGPLKRTYDQIALAIAVYEASPDISPFSRSSTMLLLTRISRS